MLLAFVLTFYPKYIFAEHFFNFDYVEYEQGIEDSSIEKIIQDKEGYMWFGTQEGLYKYDGRKAKKYTDDGKEGSLLSSDIYDIINSSDGTLWVATSMGGVGIYQREIDKFKIISKNSSPKLKHYRARRLMEFNKDIFVLGDLGIEKINQTDFTVESISVLNENNQIEVDYIARSLVVFDDKLLTLIHDRVYFYDVLLKQFKPFVFSDYRDYAYKSSSKHYNLFVTTDKSFYLYTIDGLFTVDSKYKQILKDPLITHFDKENEDDRLSIRNVFKDSYGSSWVVTNGHSIFYRPKDQKKYDSVPVGVGKNQLNTDQVFDIYEDKTKNIWVGTDGSYAAKFRAPQVSFPFYSNYHSIDRALHTNSIWSFEEFDGNTYIASDNGIFKLVMDDQHTIISPILISEKYSTSYDLLNSDNQMYIAGENGLNSLLPSGETRSHNHIIRKAKHNNIKAKHNNINSDKRVTQLAQSNSHLFVGTFNGIVAIDKANQKTTYYNHQNGDLKIHNGVIMSLAYDNKKNLLWLGSETGVEVISINFPKEAEALSEKLKQIHGYVNDIHIDKQGHVWISVDSTLYRFTPENALLQYRHFPEKEIRSIETVGRTIWMSTMSGMIKASLDNLEDFIFYIQEDGLYNTGNTTMSSIYIESKDELLFGGDKGFVKFSSKIDIPVEEAIAPKMNVVRLTNAEGHPDILDRLQSLGSLKYFENSLRFEFALLDFKAPKKTKFHYQLVGFDFDWSELSNENFASYTNLKSGDYIFKVKVFDANNVLSDKELSVHFTIETAWWKSDFAYFLYFILLLFTVLFLLRWFKTEQLRIKNLQLQKNKEEFISGYNRYALSLTELQSHQTLVRKFLDQIKLITGSEYILYKQFLLDSLLEISVGKQDANNALFSETELTTKDTIAQLFVQSDNAQSKDAVDADMQILFQQMIILQNALLDKQKYNWNDYFSSVTGLHNLKAFKNIMRDEAERAEINNLSLVFYEWSIDKAQFKENELLKRIQLLSYGDKIKDIFGAHAIATFSEKDDNSAKFVVFLSDENLEKIQQYESELNEIISELAINNNVAHSEKQNLILLRLYGEFDNYLENL